MTTRTLVILCLTVGAAAGLALSLHAQDATGDPLVADFLATIEVRAGSSSSSIFPRDCQVIDRSSSASLSGRPGGIPVLPPGTQGAVVLDLDGLEAAVFADSDGDGTPNLEDAAPENPWAARLEDLADRDGDGRPAWKDQDDDDPARGPTGDALRDAHPTTVVATERRRPYRSSGEVIETFLEGNARAGVFPPEEILTRLERRGAVPPALVDQWRRRFVTAAGK